MEAFWPEKANKGFQEGKKSKSCKHCGLYKIVRTPRMPVGGKGKKGIMVIAEAPGAEEDNQGTQLVGKAGKELRKNLKSLGMELDRDCWKLNALSCRPPNNRPPKPVEMDACRPRVWQEIQRLRPKVIFLLGGGSLTSFLGHRWKKDLKGISKWRGWCIPDRDAECWVVPTFHPSFVMRNNVDNQFGKGNASRTIFLDDLKKGVALVNKKLPQFEDDSEKVKLLTDSKDIRRFLKRVIKSKPKCAFDYETTGLKPHRKGHDIVCASIATGEECCAFPMMDSVRKTFRKFLRDGQIKKIASNKIFEELWSNVILETVVQGWWWDTMQIAHVLDNRRGTTSIKFLIYIYRGVLGYDSEVAKYKVSKNDKDGNSFNTIKKAPVKKLLIYCGLDSLYERDVAFIQKKELRKLP